MKSGTGDWACGGGNWMRCPFDDEASESCVHNIDGYIRNLIIRQAMLEEMIYEMDKKK